MLRMRFWAVLCLFVMPITVFSQSQEVIEVTTAASSDKATAGAARQDIFEKVVEQVSTQYIKDVLGESKFEKNRGIIKNKIIKNSPKYVLYLKGGTPHTKGTLTEMDVTLKISLKSLEALLLNEGLLYKMDGPPKTLPMINVVDRVNSKTYSWWTPETPNENSFLQSQLSLFHSKLREQLRPRGFYGIDPIFAHQSILTPEIFQSPRPPTEDYLLMAEFYQSQIVVRGDIVFKASDRSQSYVIEIKLVALHTGNGRVVGEVIRSYETESGSFQKVINAKLEQVAEQLAGDLSVQLHDAWKSGTFGASLISLALIGPMDYKNLSQLKKLILTQVKDVKTLRERFFAPGRVTFEVESSANTKQLAEAFKAEKFPRFQLEVSEVRTDGLDIKVDSL